MEFLNQVELKGVVGRAETKEFGENNVTTFSVVTEYSSRNEDGTLVVETTWFNCVKWWYNRIPPFELKRGDKVHLFGRLRIRSYTDQDGFPRDSWDVIVSTLNWITEE